MGAFKDHTVDTHNLPLWDLKFSGRKEVYFTGPGTSGPDAARRYFAEHPDDTRSIVATRKHDPMRGQYSPIYIGIPNIEE